MAALAADGSRVETPNGEENRRVYGESENKCGKAAARANFSGLYDVYNRFFLDIGVRHFRSGGLEEAKEHIGELKAIAGERPTLIVFDRSYTSLEFMNYLEKGGIKRLIRLHSGDYKAEATGMGSGDEEVELVHAKTRLEHLRRTNRERAGELARECSTPERTLKMRFDNGETGALITNPSDCGAADIKRLYRKRWMIEPVPNRDPAVRVSFETGSDRKETPRLEKQDEN
ncbi:MAG: transposase [Treponema sp.]|nr:transposase [Treponema sp.]